MPGPRSRLRIVPSLAVAVGVLACAAGADARIAGPPPVGTLPPVVGPPPAPPIVEIDRTTFSPSVDEVVPKGRIRVSGAGFVLRRDGTVLADTRGGPDPAVAPVRTQPGDVLELFTRAGGAAQPAYVLADVGLPTIERCRVRERTFSGRRPPLVSPQDSDSWSLYPFGTGTLAGSDGRYSVDLPRGLRAEDELKIKSERHYPSGVIVVATATRIAGFCAYGPADAAAVFEYPYPTTRGVWVQGQCHPDSRLVCAIRVTARITSGPHRGKPAMRPVRLVVRPGRLMRADTTIPRPRFPWNRRMRSLIAAGTPPSVRARLERFHPEGKQSSAEGSRTTSCERRPTNPVPSLPCKVRAVPWRDWPQWAGPIPARTVPF